MPDSPRVLHIGKYYPPVHGGIERFLGDLAEAQRGRGHAVTVLAHGQRIDTANDPSWVRRCPVWFRLVFAPISPAFPLWLARAIRATRPAVIHIHMPNPSAFWVLALPAARRLPWVVHWHADVEPSRFKPALRLLYPYYRLFERALLEQAAAVVVTSANYLQASSPLRPWHYKCRVVPLGVEPGRLPEVAPEEGDGLWRPSASPPASGRARPFRLLAIGRLTYYKGFDTLIRAVADLAEVELVVVGEGEERPGLEAILAKAGQPPHIRLLGAADDAACRRLLASCDLYCLPSRERTEAFGIVLMEAMRYGKPLLASRIPGSGVTWVAREGDNAVLVPPDDVAAWQAAIEDLARDAERRRRLGENGRRRFLAEFAIGPVATRLDRLYAALLPEPAPIRGGKERPLIIIPALDEAASIGAVIREARAFGFGDVLVVDDGSRDGTGRIARAEGARVLRAPLGQGAWGAMQTGIRQAVREGYPGVITMDADGQHEPACLADLLAAAALSDVVIGAYPARGSRPRRLAWAYFRLLTGFSYEDLTSGFRYYNRRACHLLAGAGATLLDYQDIGVLLILRRAGLAIAEIPVSMNPRQNGPSRIFFSWWAVTRYMAETTLLCLARWKIKPRDACRDIN